jgi:hypothetical protein
VARKMFLPVRQKVYHTLVQLYFSQSGLPLRNAATKPGRRGVLNVVFRGRLTLALPLFAYIKSEIPSRGSVKFTYEKRAELPLLTSRTFMTFIFIFIVIILVVEEYEELN